MSTTFRGKTDRRLADRVQTTHTSASLETVFFQSAVHNLIMCPLHRIRHWQQVVGQNVPTSWAYLGVLAQFEGDKLKRFKTNEAPTHQLSQATDAEVNSLN